MIVVWNNRYKVLSGPHAGKIVEIVCKKCCAGNFSIKLLGKKKEHGKVIWVTRLIQEVKCPVFGTVSDGPAEPEERLVFPQGHLRHLGIRGSSTSDALGNVLISNLDFPQADKDNIKANYKYGALYKRIGCHTA